MKRQNLKRLPLEGETVRHLTRLTVEQLGHAVGGSAPSEYTDICSAIRTCPKPP